MLESSARKKKNHSGEQDGHPPSLNEYKWENSKILSSYIPYYASTHWVKYFILVIMEVLEITR